MGAYEDDVQAYKDALNLIRQRQGALGVDDKGNLANPFVSGNSLGLGVKDEGGGKWGFYRSGNRLADAYDPRGMNLGAGISTKAYDAANMNLNPSLSSRSMIGSKPVRDSGVIAGPGSSPSEGHAGGFAGGPAVSKKGGILDFLAGPVDPGTAPDPIVADIYRTQSKAAAYMDRMRRDYENELDKLPVEDEAQQDVTDATRGVRANQSDLQRRIQQLQASRGYGPTSMFQGAQKTLNDNADEEVENLNNSIPARIAQLRKDRSFRSAGIGSKILTSQNVPTDFFGTPSAGRQGGLLPLLGAGIGAFAGGPSGAALGMGLGQMGQGYLQYR